MKTKLFKTAIFIFLISFVAGAAFLMLKNKDSAFQDRSWETVQEKGVLVVGLDDTFAPMGFRDEEGEITGFDIDLAQEVAKRLKLEVIFQPCVWSTIFMELGGRTIDLIWNGVSMSEAREKQALFSDPYAMNRMVIVVNERSKNMIKSKDDLNGKKVAVQAGSPALDYIQGYKDADFNPLALKELVQYPDNYTALLDLHYGGVDAVVLDEVVADYYIAQKKAPLLKLREVFATEKYGIAFRKNDRALRDKIQETLDAMERDGTAAKISKKWFGRNNGVRPSLNGSDPLI